ncbi:hypothetical protein PsorP6_001026 [Peronosclerospora sorghi]|uniref:Uncharacterized protein n=1 Tax=Peronosclerospora sorghi TaxID=230839 RepID=A0ACC0WT30_9STRA|nr:hypothetical protein PsorP6_001026 [Peronosclerospora sorghi]
MTLKNVMSFEDSEAAIKVHMDDKTKKMLQKAYEKDPKIREVFNGKDNYPRYVRLKRLIYRDSENKTKRLCIPNDEHLKVKILHNCHDDANAAHPGTMRTYLLGCEAYTRYKSSTSRKNGLMQPIPVPSECWEVISMDFITKLPVSGGYNAIMNVFCKLSKRPAYVPTHTNATATDTAKIFINGN